MSINGQLTIHSWPSVYVPRPSTVRVSSRNIFKGGGAKLEFWKWGGTVHNSVPCRGVWGHPSVYLGKQYIITHVINVPRPSPKQSKTRQCEGLEMCLLNTVYIHTLLYRWKHTFLRWSYLKVLLARGSTNLDPSSLPCGVTNTWEKRRVQRQQRS